MNNINFNNNSNNSNNSNNNYLHPLRFVYRTYNSNINDDIPSSFRDIIFNNLTNTFENILTRNNRNNLDDITQNSNPINFDEDIRNIINDNYYRNNIEQENNSDLTFERVAFDFRFPTLQIFDYIFQDYIENKNKLNEEEFNNNVDFINYTLDEHNNSQINEVSIECPICFETHTKYINIKKCSHKFCEQCIKKWLKDHKNTCPVCRVEISTVIKNSESNDSLNSNNSDNGNNSNNLEHLI